MSDLPKVGDVVKIGLGFRKASRAQTTIVAEYPDGAYAVTATNKPVRLEDIEKIVWRGSRT